MFTCISNKTGMFGLLLLFLFNPSHLWANSLSSSAANCHLYGINDTAKSHSQLFSLTAMRLPDTLTLGPLGHIHRYHDLETLTLHPHTQILYAAASDNALHALQGTVFTFNAAKGRVQALSQIDTPIESLTFTEDGQLWGWANGVGLLSIDPETGATEVVFSSDVTVEGLLGAGSDTLLATVKTSHQGAFHTHLWQYNYVEQTAHLQCQNIPGEIEAITHLHGNRFLVGTHANDSLYGLDIKTCFLIPNVIPNTGFGDIEGLAIPHNCPLANQLNKSFIYRGYVAQMDAFLKTPLINEPPLGELKQKQVHIYHATLQGKQALFYTRPDAEPTPAPTNAGLGLLVSSAAGETGYSWVYRDSSGRLMQHPVRKIPADESDIERLELVIYGGVEHIEFKLVDGTFAVYNDFMVVRGYVSKPVPFPEDIFDGDTSLDEYGESYRITYPNGHEQYVHIDEVEILLGFDW